jgi:hypothetical protein
LKEDHAAILAGVQAHKLSPLLIAPQTLSATVLTLLLVVLDKLEHATRVEMSSVEIGAKPTMTVFWEEPAQFLVGARELKPYKLFFVPEDSLKKNMKPLHT